MKQREIFEALTRNAFDFLKRGIAEFDGAPKYSVIHFCAAVEMLLKARLMQEHWSLIVSRPDKANLGKFIEGDFVSVTLEDTRIRLRDVAGEDIDDAAYNSFKELAKHRNKMVHFFHPQADGDDQAREKIVAEQCRSWFHLHRLLNRWDACFHEFMREVAKADRAMKGHRKYLSAKFKAIKPELDAARKAGNKPKACNACGFKSAISNEVDDLISLLNCVVCDHREVQVEIECPHCHRQIAMANGGYSRCGKCGGEIEPDAVAEALYDAGATHQAIKDGEEAWQLGNCDECDGYETVVQRDADLYFCASCFEIFRSVQWCEWCNTPNTGDMEHSYIAGCNHCEGKAGWERDE
ncbi:MAG: hypothetical protein QM599_04210 [Pseudoxanthomonas sp.]